MGDVRVVLADVALPDFGEPAVEPKVPAEEYEERLVALRPRARERGLVARARSCYAAAPAHPGCVRPTRLWIPRRAQQALHG